MHVVLWDTRRNRVSKGYAGGFGVGTFRGGGICGGVIRRFMHRDRRPTSLLFAYLAAAFGRRGHAVRYVVDARPPEADLYVFCPALPTLDVEIDAMRRLLKRRPDAKILVAGAVASTVPEAFAGLRVTLVQGDAERLHERLDEVLSQQGETVRLGTVEHLDELPRPDWSPFRPERFRVSQDFCEFPTALIESGRGCIHRCSYCPYLVSSPKLRLREPAAVVDEMLHGARRWGFRSFKFRDPLFGCREEHALHLADLLCRAGGDLRFSVETRPDLLSFGLLRALKRAGLACVTLGIQGAQGPAMAQQGRNLALEECENECAAQCRALGIRTIASFVIGFPTDTLDSIHETLRRARQLNPTFADFNLLTPYPGTAYAAEHADRILDRDWRRYTSHEPVLSHPTITPEEMLRSQARCYRGFYFRTRYWTEHGIALRPQSCRRAETRAAEAAAAVLPSCEMGDARDARPAAAGGATYRWEPASEESAMRTHAESTGSPR